MANAPTRSILVRATGVAVAWTTGGVVAWEGLLDFGWAAGFPDDTGAGIVCDWSTVAATILLEIGGALCGLILAGGGF